MNYYPIWKYCIILTGIIIGIIYTIPNFFRTIPTVEISSSKLGVSLNIKVIQLIKKTLQNSHITYSQKNYWISKNNKLSKIDIFLPDLETQLRTRELLEKTFKDNNSDYIIAISLQNHLPHWLKIFHANPAHLGLDLSGGIHFLLEVDVNTVFLKQLSYKIIEVINILKKYGYTNNNVKQEKMNLIISVTSQKIAENTRYILKENLYDFNWYIKKCSNHNFRIIGCLSDLTTNKISQDILTQNISILRNRINQLGINESIIQKHGNNRIVIELPGIQDPTKAKSIIGRTATLEARLVNDITTPLFYYLNNFNKFQEQNLLNNDVFNYKNNTLVYTQKNVIFTGNHITHALASFDEYHQPCVLIKINSSAGKILQNLSRNNIGKPIAIILLENKKGEILTVATIMSEIGQTFQITGLSSIEAASNLALLLRSGSLAAPVNIIEERIIGPSLGNKNISLGIQALFYGFIAINIFMILYYRLFGLFSFIGLLLNVLLVIAILSILQITLTLPGIAAIALTIGIAIDSNVLINERIREELKKSKLPQTAISIGFSHAWSTILDSNVTMFISGLALLFCSSGPIRGFAIIHCIGILTSLFTSVFFVRGLVNLWYGNKKNLHSLSIG